MAMTDKYRPPQPDRLDAVHSGIQAALASIPVASELFLALVTPSLDKRRQKWMKEIGEGLRCLEAEKGIRLEELQENEAFIDIVMQASTAALRTSQEEKRQALRNAILNAALPSAPEDSLQQLFVSLIDDFHVWHLRILKLFQSPTEWMKVNNRSQRERMIGSPSGVLTEAYPELSSKREFYDQVWKDLFTRGFVGMEGLHTMMSGHGIMQGCTTGLGNQFLKFIEVP